MDVRELLVEPVVEAEVSDSVIDTALAGVRWALSDRAGGVVFGRWRGHAAARGGWRQEVWGPRDERVLDDLRGTDFGALQGAVERLTAVAAAVGVVREGAGGLRGRLADTWGGRGADSAAGRFDEFARQARGWQEKAVRLAAAVDGARGAVRSAAREWGVQAESVRGIEVDHLPTRLTQIDRLDGAVRANPVGLLRTHGAHALTVPGADPWSSAEVIEYLDGYCSRYEAAIARFRRDLAAVHKATTDTWDLFVRLLPGEPPPTPAPAQQPAHQEPATACPVSSGHTTEPGPGAVACAETPPPTADPQRQAPTPQTSTPTGGAPGGMMGGMGGGGGGGGDTERKSSQWRLVGSLFDDTDPATRFDGIIGEDPANRARG
ncbi:hypothetical protein CLV68_1357 [Actinokineospora cianjurensis]|uniref:WXG100 family type VII secretion target n=1 Tax=Actinokineospora cianjurensis TaxID=585224 RepID=A0A421B9G4_9PSEU|nr:hypothetical protein CLV68_1357 [Actinokineospora cianjurensis]